MPSLSIAIVVARSNGSRPSFVVATAATLIRCHRCRTPLSHCSRPLSPPLPSSVVAAAVALHWVAVLVHRCPPPSHSTRSRLAVLAALRLVRHGHRRTPLDRCPRPLWPSSSSCSESPASPAIAAVAVSYILRGRRRPSPLLLLSPSSVADAFLVHLGRRPSSTTAAAGVFFCRSSSTAGAAVVVLFCRSYYPLPQLSSSLSTASNLHRKRRGERKRHRKMVGPIKDKIYVLLYFLLHRH